MKKIIYLAIFTMGLIACQKDEGKGGSASIEGKVFAYDVNSDGIRQDSGYIMDQKVYITYGDGNFVDDEVRTSGDGSFLFKGLQKGTYTVRVFGYCPSCPLDQFEDKVVTTIDKAGQNVVVRDLKTQFK
ncbi:MAG: hypothetical protein IPO14_07525 [Saprospiraceae bacterium]|nr:hypothetical protein [Saprospiraceae bacterium]